MLNEIKNKIEKELFRYAYNLDKLYSFPKISALLLNHIKNFTLRKGKRLRPVLFMIGYLGFAKKQVPGLYKSALSFELLHDFFLVHDDIIDKSYLRRGKLSLHKLLDNYLGRYKNIKFSGEDLAILIGDIIYALSLDAFLSIKEQPERKAAALKKFIEAAIYTACGEFVELVSGLKDIDKITKNDIYKIYDLKTAYYSFVYPLTIGATLAGASKKQIMKLTRYGLYLGRAFQIKDDILGIFGSEKVVGKSILSDLKEAKKTMLIWHVCYNSSRQNRLIIKKILSKKKIDKSDLLKVRKIIIETQTLDYAKKEIIALKKQAGSIIPSLRMRKDFKDLLNAFSEEILAV
ncbi:MAG: polyprenyl synthetase family protein [Candidatus Omnitrophica bacterium]|nr:polyprenyl synthetase family protein [Candidatus Omnitrophota bacterium]